MRLLLLTLLVLAWAMPGLAATTSVVPITVVPGSVASVDHEFLPDSLPFSIAIASNPSCSGTGTFSGELISDGVEVEVSITAPSGGCRVGEEVQMIVEFEVPELGGTVTMVRVRATPIVAFPIINEMTGEIIGGANASTSSVPGSFQADFTSRKLDFGNAATPTYRGVASLIALIPGDTVQIPIKILVDFQDGSPYVATLRIRYEFLVTVPEPSAALSLPIGAAWLAGLAGMKGGA